MIQAGYEQFFSKEKLPKSNLETFAERTRKKAIQTVPQKGGSGGSGMFQVPITQQEYQNKILAYLKKRMKERGIDTESWVVRYDTRVENGIGISELRIGKNGEIDPTEKLHMDQIMHDLSTIPQDVLLRILQGSE
jgi:hypothetical protein